MSKRRNRKKRQIYRDCWDLDFALILWFKEHLPVYLKSASKFIDLEYYKFEWQGREYTQKEMIEMMITLINKIDMMSTWDNEYPEKVNEFFDMWKLVGMCMWW